MATYHVVTVLRPGCEPDPDTRPGLPADFIADSEADAVDKAEALIAEIAWQYRDTGRERRAAAVREWQAVARRVDRPAIALEPHKTVIEIVHDGQVVGVNYEYGETARAESFDLLVDGILSGWLLRKNAATGRAWVIADAVGALAALVDRRWPDQSPPGLWETMHWVESVVLPDIRQALEAG